MRSLPAEKDYPDRTRTALQQQYSASKLDIRYEKLGIAECVIGDEKAVLSGKSQSDFRQLILLIILIWLRMEYTQRQESI